ncbi:MAG: ERF family protein [Desulfitobacteriaceae bacterium]
MSHIKIAAKLLEVMQGVGYLQKDKENKEQHYKYLSTEHTLEKINEELLKQKLVTRSEYQVTESKEKPTKNGAIWQLVTVSCTLTVLDVESDEVLVNVAYGSGTDSGDKAVAKAQTMARKYAWLAALNIPVGDDPEEDPVTDKQEFVTVSPTQQLINDISQIWYSNVRDGSQLASYTIARYGRPLEQLNSPELGALKNEFENYWRQA